MDRRDKNLDPSTEALLDYHLGQLSLADSSAADFSALETAIRSDDSTAARSRSLSAWLGLLQAYECPAPAPDTVDRVMQRVQRAPNLRLVPAPTAANASPAFHEGARDSLLPVGAAALPPADMRPAARGRFALREFIAVAACLTFMVSVLVPGVGRVRSVSRRSLCAGNMSSVYQGLAQYASDYNGNLPQIAGFVPGTNWLRPTAPGAPPMSNSRNLFLVVRYNYARPGSFICPSAAGSEQPAQIAFDSLSDFPSRAHCGFDFQNMAGPTLPLAEGGPRPILADHNPLFDNRKGVSPLTPDSNSLSHEAAGQNVLLTDGQVRWATTPNAHAADDNIWQVQGIENYTGTEYQQRPEDTFIVP